MIDLKWTDDKTFEIGGEKITLDYEHGGSKRSSDVGDFTMMKGKEFLNHYTSLADSGFKRVLELGIYQGGSFVFLDKILAPRKLSAIDLSQVRLPALDTYVSANSSRCSVHYGISQDDAKALNEIIDNDLGGEVDLVVDDASHFYEPTKASFEVAFPRVKPGGLYIIEDWTWNFQDAFQGSDAPWKDQNALANLVVDLMEDMALCPLIEAIEIHRPMLKVWRSKVKSGSKPFAKLARRGRPQALI